MSALVKEFLLMLALLEFLIKPKKRRRQRLSGLFCTTNLIRELRERAYIDLPEPKKVLDIKGGNNHHNHIDYKSIVDLVIT